MSGYVYCLSNQSFKQNIYKIGLSKNEPKKRCKQLFTTGVPTKFEVEMCIKVENCDEVEKEIHEKFSKYRVNPKREFFEIDIKLIEKEFDKYHKRDTEQRLHKREKTGIEYFWSLLGY